MLVTLGVFRVKLWQFLSCENHKAFLPFLMPFLQTPVFFVV